MVSNAIQQNGLLSPPQTVRSSVTSSPPRVVLAGRTGRILCVADIRGDYHELNKLIRENEATAVIHTGDFGFNTADSVNRMEDKILRHLITHCPLLPPATQKQLLSIPVEAGRAALLTELNNSSRHFPLSQFPHLLSGAITFPVPVFTTWGLIEDYEVIEKFRTGEYEVHNLNVIDEANTRVIDVSGVKLRLFGLGGTLAPNKMFDNGHGHGSIAGGSGTMWTTALQIGELIATSQQVYDPSETRLFVASANISKHGILSQLAHALKADLTVSGGLHFRYPVSYSEFSVTGDFEGYRQKLIQARDAFMSIYEMVKVQVDSSMNAEQQTLLKNMVNIVQNIPAADDGAYTSRWHWVLTDAPYGHVLFSIAEGRISAETKSSGLNFAHRMGKAPPPLYTPVQPVLSQQKPSAPVQRAVPSSALPPSPSPSIAQSKESGTVNSHHNQVFRGVPNRPSASNINPALKAAAATQTQLLRPTPPSNVSITKQPSPPTTSVAPSGGPAKPQVAQPTRAPRGPGGITGQTHTPTPAFKTSGKQDNKPTQPPRPAAPAKDTKERSNTTNPRVNGKGPSSSPNSTPAPSTAEKSTSKPADEKKVGSTEKVPDADVSADAKTPIASGSTAAGETAQTGDTAESGDAEASSSVKKWSLYVKALPSPITEDDLRKSFGASSGKIVHIKLPWDHMNNRNREYGYVDFASEADMQQGLSDSTGLIGEKTIKVSISNPPVFGGHASRGSRGRGGFRGRGMRGGITTVGHKKEGSGEKKETKVAEKKD